jgi:hypothetical protein
MLRDETAAEAAFTALRSVLLMARSLADRLRRASSSVALNIAEAQ